MDLLALPLSWLELLATTALAPAEIARLQTVCRVLRDLLAADQIWRESVPRPAHHALPVSVPRPQSAQNKHAVVPVCLQVRSVHNTAFGSSPRPAHVASGRGTASGERTCASSVPAQASSRCEPRHQTDAALCRQRRSRCGCAKLATLRCTRSEPRVNGHRLASRVYGQAKG
jgi:hypothetical protein